MQLPAFAAWTWIPIVIGAALAQTIRNATQRTLTSQVGTLPATLVRFLYGLPFTVLWLLLVIRLSPAYREPIHFGAGYFAWLTLGATAQLAATALLLLAMKERNFVVAVAYSKTEVLQVALFATLFLNELPTLMAGLAMLIATAGVVMLSLPKIAVPGGFTATSLLSKLALYGLGSGACFALASVGYRGAAIMQTGTSPWLIGAWGVLWAQLIQTALLGSYLARQQPGALTAIARAWRLSSLAGTMGAMASIGWFTATALRPAADVRTLGLVEVLFSFLVSHRLFNEKLGSAERIGLVLVTAGLVVICAQL
jgi:drug/metabolite transporter (DMT)-like permease